MNLEKAIKIAVDAHTGQFDKGNNPYILHPLRVMLSLEKKNNYGILYDVVATAMVGLMKSSIRGSF